MAVEEIKELPVALMVAVVIVSSYTLDPSLRLCLGLVVPVEPGVDGHIITLTQT